MSNVCYHHFSGKKTDVPPRRQLTRRTKLLVSSEHNDPDPDEALLQRFLPYNNGDDAEESDPYSTDEFRMYEFKVRRCLRSCSHDWTDCPFAHPGEKARRRDPRRFHYSGNACTDFRRGLCRRGEACEFAHGVFECWLHPARYRTQACKDGKNCKRKVCFFAHTPQQLRVFPLQSGVPALPFANSNYCCVFCHSVASSPTSTLMDLSHFSPPLSPSLSPPRSPVSNSYPPQISKYNEPSNQFLPGVLSYRNTLVKLVSALEDIGVGQTSPACVDKRNLSWLDATAAKCEDQLQFVLSPSGSRKFSNEDGLGNSFFDEKINDNSLSCPDLEWVDELVR